VAQAWVQFMRDDVAQSVNGLNNRLNAILDAASAIPENSLDREARGQVARIREEVGRAANVTAGLLRRVDAMAPESVPRMVEPFDMPPLRPASILVVEDDGANRSAITRLFQRFGHYVTPCTNGLEALESLKVALPDCVICDVRMPVLGGKSLFEQLETLMPNMAARFVFVTGAYTDSETRTFLEQSGQPVVAKPYEVAELLAAVATVLKKVGAIAR
jgi:CheY-like chemotaxis protein